jgi:hypothetical protein
MGPCPFAVDRAIWRSHWLQIVDKQPQVPAPSAKQLAAGSRIERAGIHFIPQRGRSQTSKATGRTAQPLLSRSCLRSLVFEFSDSTRCTVRCSWDTDFAAKVRGREAVSRGSCDAGWNRAGASRSRQRGAGRVAVVQAAGPRNPCCEAQGVEGTAATGTANPSENLSEKN